MFRHTKRVLATAVATVLAATFAPVATAAATPSTAGSSDPFYTYDSSTPLSSYAPGTVLKKRTLQYHIVGYPLRSRQSSCSTAPVTLRGARPPT